LALLIILKNGKIAKISIIKNYFSIKRAYLRIIVLTLPFNNKKPIINNSFIILKKYG